ncbi:MAG: L,D-transpeptidase family protein, partial [Verrucomicrobiota bacterium]
YKANGGKNLWPKPVSTDDHLLAVFNGVKTHALSNRVVPTFRVSTPPEGTKVSQEDLLKSMQVISASLAVKYGSVHQSKVWKYWNSGDRPGSPPSSEADQLFAQAYTEQIRINRKYPDRVVGFFAPQNPVYSKLHRAWQDIQNGPVSPNLPSRGLVRPGDDYVDTVPLGKFLKSKGFLTEEQFYELDIAYTEPLVTAVKAFQEGNGLKADGILGPQTYAQINRDPRDNLDTIELNLQRARLLPDDMGERYLIANLPSGKVYGFDGDQLGAEMRVVFGKNTSDRRTPMFRDEIEEVVFRPYWWIPPSIFKNEVLPRALGNPSYMTRNRYEIVRGWPEGTVMANTSSNLYKVQRKVYNIRQRAGTGNALGLVKFLFPNQHNVYMHDTPTKYLFNSTYRAHSHGCVRLQHPEEMANWVLKDRPEWTASRIKSAMYDADKRTPVNLDAPINVYIVYFTAFPRMDDKPGVNFLKDVYSRDSKLAAALR